MSAVYRVEFTPAAARQLAKLNRQAREMVAAAIVALAGNPRPAGCVKLSGRGDLWRVRVRNYRVVYRIEDDRLVVTVVKLGDCKDVYR
jgi:mRNA interferase RelE/StbE